MRLLERYANLIWEYRQLCGQLEMSCGFALSNLQLALRVLAYQTSSPSS